MIGVKCSLGTHEDLSKKPGVAEHVSKPNTGEEGRDRLVPELAGWSGGQAVSVHQAHRESKGLGVIERTMNINF